jgi:hypothetical protein
MSFPFRKVRSSHLWPEWKMQVGGSQEGGEVTAGRYDVDESHRGKSLWLWGCLCPWINPCQRPEVKKKIQQVSPVLCIEIIYSLDEGRRRRRRSCSARMLKRQDLQPGLGSTPGTLAVAGPLCPSLPSFAPFLCPTPNVVSLSTKYLQFQPQLRSLWTDFAGYILLNSSGSFYALWLSWSNLRDCIDQAIMPTLSKHISTEET